MEVMRQGEWAGADWKSTLRCEHQTPRSLEDGEQGTDMIRQALWNDRWKFMG